jgi:hypothetical protein
MPQHSGLGYSISHEYSERCACRFCPVHYGQWVIPAF